MNKKINCRTVNQNDEYNELIKKEINEKLY